MNIQADESDWLALHEEIQTRFHRLTEEVAAVNPGVTPRYGKTIATRIPLFSYVSFRRPNVADSENVIVGVTPVFEGGKWFIAADVSDEEEGTIFFEFPRTPFAATTFDELRKNLLNTVDQFLVPCKPVLMRLLSPPSVAPGREPPAMADTLRSR